MFEPGPPNLLPESVTLQCSLYALAAIGAFHILSLAATSCRKSLAETVEQLALLAVSAIRSWRKVRDESGRRETTK